MKKSSSFTIEAAVANQGGAMETRDHFKNGTSPKSLMSRGNINKELTMEKLGVFEQKQDRREFLGKFKQVALWMLVAKLATSCGKPEDEVDPDPNGGGSGSGKTPKDTRSNSKLETDSIDLIKKCCQDDKHETKYEALEHFVKNLDALLKLNEKNLIGKLANFEGNLRCNSKLEVTGLNMTERKVTSGDCLERKRTYGFKPLESNPKYDSENFYYHVDCK